MDDEETELKSTFEMTSSLLEDPDTRVSAAMKLLEVLQEDFPSYSLEDGKRVLTEIARRLDSPPISIVSSIMELIEIYQSCEEIDMVLVVVDVLPQILTDVSSEIVCTCVERLRVLLSQDSRLKVPVIGAIASMSLSKQNEEELFEMTKDALDVVEENDVPSVIRALIRLMSNGSRRSDEIVSLIRKQSESSTLSTSTRTLVYSIVSETVQMNYHAMQSFLKTIDREPRNGLIFLDAVVLLSLFSKRKTKPMAIKSIQASAPLIRDNGHVFVRLASRLPLLSHHGGTNNIATATIQNILEFFRVLMQTTPNLSRPQQLQLRIVLIEAYINLFSHQVRSRSEILAEMLRFVSVTCDDEGEERVASLCAGARRWERMRSHLSATASRIGSAVLYRIVYIHPTLLAEYASHIDDALERKTKNNVAFHRLCVVRTEVAREKKCASQLLIGVQKRMFFGNSVTPGILMASHLLQSASLPPEEQNSLLSWIFSTIPKRHEDANKTTIAAFDALTNASAQFSRRLRLEFLKRHLNPLMSSILLVQQEKDLHVLEAFSNDRTSSSNRIVVDVKKAVSKKMNPRYVAALLRCYLTHRNYSLLRDLPSVAYSISSTLHGVMTGVVDEKNVRVESAKMLCALASAVSICASDRIRTTTSNHANMLPFEIAHAWIAYDASALSSLLCGEKVEMTIPISPKTLIRAVTFLPMSRDKSSSSSEEEHLPGFRLRLLLLSHLSSLLGIVNSNSTLSSFGEFCCTEIYSKSNRVVTAREAIEIPDINTIQLPSFPKWLPIVKSLAIEMRCNLQQTTSHIKERRSYMCLLSCVFLFLFRWFVEDHNSPANRRALIEAACVRRTSKKDTESKHVHTLYREWTASLSRSGDSGNALLLSELMVMLDRCVPDRAMRSTTAAAIVQTICSSHSHMTSDILELSPLPRTMRCSSSICSNDSAKTWLRQLKSGKDYHSKKKNKLKRRSRLYLTPHLMFTIFSDDFLCSIDSLELLQLFVSALRDFMESQVNDAETKCEVTEIHPIVRSLSLHSFDIFLESTLFSTLYCLQGSRPLEFREMDGMFTPYDTINVALSVFQRVLYFILIDFERHDHKFETFLRANSVHVSLIVSEQMCKILKDKVELCLDWRASTEDRPKEFKPYLGASKLHDLFRNSNRVLSLIERICRGVKKGSSSIVKKKGKKKFDAVFINIKCVKYVPKVVLALETCRTYLQTSLGLLGIDRIEDKVEEEKSFIPLCSDTRHFISRNKGLFTLKDWISQISRRAKKSNKNVATKRSRDIENASQNTQNREYNKNASGGTGGGSKFEARVRNPSKQRRIHRFITEED